MRFVEQFSVVYIDNNDQIQCMRGYNTYEEAHDAIIEVAYSKLPVECVKEFTIDKQFVNVAAGA